MQRRVPPLVAIGLFVARLSTNGRWTELIARALSDCCRPRDLMKPTPGQPRVWLSTCPDRHGAATGFRQCASPFPNHIRASLRNELRHRSSG